MEPLGIQLRTNLVRQRVALRSAPSYNGQMRKLLVVLFYCICSVHLLHQFAINFDANQSSTWGILTHA